jgi:4-amino-4-deoxy-L-arabinose transferase-like glycosyltransferase
MKTLGAFNRFIIPVGLTLLATFLRLYHLDDFIGGVDHSYPIAQVIKIYQNGQWPTIGQYTSVLVDNPPGMPYLLLLPWWIFQNVWGVHCFVVLLNILAVPLIYACLRWLLRTEVPAQGAAFLMAVNPWIIYHSQGTWVQGLMVFFTTLTFVLLAKTLFGSTARRSERLLATFLSITVFTQTYLLAFFSAIQVGLMLALNWRRLAWRSLLLGIVIFAIPTGFYVYQISARGLTQAQSDKLSGFVQTNRYLKFNSIALEHALRYVTGRDFEIIYGNDGSMNWQVRRWISLALSWTLAICVFAGIGRALWQVIQKTEKASFWLLTLLWWSLPIAVMSFENSPIHIHYLLISLPAGFVLISPILASLFRSSKLRVVSAIFISGFYIMALDANSYLTQRNPAGGNLDRLSLQAILQFQQVADKLVDQYGLSEAYVRWDSASLSANVGHDLQAVNWFELPQFQIIPIDRPALYIDLKRGRPAQLPLLAKREAQLDYAGEDHITFDVIPAYNRAQIAELPQQKVEWPTIQGLTLIGYDLIDQQHLDVYYAIDTLADERGQWLYAPYAHFTNAHGEIVANIGSAGISGYYYRAGDVYIYRIEIPELPAGKYELELGLFDGVHGGVGVTFLPPDETPRPFYTTYVWFH